MAKVKVFLEDGETELDAQLAIYKALQLHNSGDVHTESFEDPAMIHAQQRFEEIHEKIYKEMIAEISQQLDEEFSE